jgi:hypothetical protein
VNNCAVVIPVYKPSLDADELFSVSHSLLQLQGHDIHWVAPQSLDVTYYVEKFKAKNVQRFEDGYFKNIEGYNRLLVSLHFYQRFDNYEFMLICQPDAIVLRPDLHTWLEKPYDYIGAPWPQGFSLKIQTASIPMADEINCTAFVGNGGLSLRRNAACIELMNEFPDVREQWSVAGHAEDLFFSFVGNLSQQFRIPNLMTAAHFAHDIDPTYLQKLISGQDPFGVHAWRKYESQYWLKRSPWVHSPNELPHLHG